MGEGERNFAQVLGLGRRWEEGGEKGGWREFESYSQKQ